MTMTDSKRRKQYESNLHMAYWNEWLLRAEALSQAIHKRRHGEYVALETLEQIAEFELEHRDRDHLEE